jgi:hypothetical protein
VPDLLARLDEAPRLLRRQHAPALRHAAVQAVRGQGLVLAGLVDLWQEAVEEFDVGHAEPHVPGPAHRCLPR